METNPTVIRHWDDVVFENRNKLYGAYILRRAYSNRLLSGLGVTVAIVTVILSLHDTRSRGEEVLAPPTLPETEIILRQPPSLEPRRPPERRVQPPVSNVDDRNVLVTTEEVTEVRTEAIEEYISQSDFDFGEIGVPEGEVSAPPVAPQPVAEPFRDFAEVMPEYEGGLEAMMKFLQKKIHYPRVPRQMLIEGTVYVRFLVNGDGSVSDVEVIRGIHPDCDREAMRVISMLPSWKGGSHNGRPVSVRMVLPIKFELK